jgi:ABC-type multidrug transport system ATPase subunit
VQHTCSRAIIIADGQLKADGPPASLASEGNVLDVTLRSRDNGSADAVARLLRALPGVSDLHTAQTVEQGAMAFTLTSKGDADLRESLFDTAVQHKLVLLSLQRHTVSLEETFRKLTLADTGPSSSSLSSSSSGSSASSAPSA